MGKNFSKTNPYLAHIIDVPQGESILLSPWNTQMVNYKMWAIEGMGGIDTGAYRTRKDWSSMGWGRRWEMTYDKKAALDQRLSVTDPCLRNTWSVHDLSHD